MTFNNETNLVIGNKHNDDQQQHEHRTGKSNIFISSRQEDFCQEMSNPIDRVDMMIWWNF